MVFLSALFKGTICAFLFVFSGDIGGQMGLFIGASILTILELFDYLYEVKYLPSHQEPLTHIQCNILSMEKCTAPVLLKLPAHKMEFFTQFYHPHKDVC